MDWFVPYWIVVGLLAVSLSIIYAAWHKEEVVDPESLIMGMVFIGFTWPLLLVIAIILSPFFILYWIVAFIRDRHDEKRYDKNI